MTTTETETTYRLIAVFDLREWDEAAECYMDILPEQKSMCDHCGRLHAKVYVVQRIQDRQEFQIGGGCARKHLDGWQPEKEEVKRLEKEALALAKNKAHQKLVDIAMPIAEKVSTMTVPEIVQVDTKRIRNEEIPVYGMADSGVRVWCRELLTEERERCCIDAWKREQVEIQVKVLYPPTSPLIKDDKNWKRRSKIANIIRNELGIY